MGYRSDVTGIIRFESNEDREKFVLMVQARNDEMYKMCFGNEDSFNDWKHDYKDEPIMTLQLTDIKWYSEYPDVKAHYELCAYAIDTFKAEWRIVQLGEDGATEEEGSDDNTLEDYVQVVHNIETHFGN